MQPRSAMLLGIRGRTHVEQGDGNYMKPVHESVIVLVLRVVFIQLCLAIATLLVTILLVTSISAVNNSTLLTVTLSIVNTLILIADAILITGIVIEWAHYRYVITPEEITIDSGIVHVERRIYKTTDLRSVELEQSILGKLLNYGTITFYSRFFRHGVRLPNIPNPQRYVEMLSAHTSTA